METANSNDGVAIRATGLVKEFGKFPAVKGIDFEVHHGEIFGFLGPNGSGKTTTIRMLLGLLPPTQGEMEVTLMARGNPVYRPGSSTDKYVPGHDHPITTVTA